MSTISPEILFKVNSEQSSKDLDRINLVSNRINNYNALVNKAKEQYKNIELAKRRASALKNKAIENLEKNLIDFEASFIKRGGKIIWAQDAEEALFEINNLITKSDNNKKIITNKSRIAEDLKIKESVKSIGFEVLDTDFNEYICSASNQESFHLSNIAINISDKEISELFTKKFSTSRDLPTEDLVDFFNEHYYAKLTEADISICGADFLIADTGSVVISELNANSIIASSSPKIQIIIVGIDQLLSSIVDLDLFLPLYSTFTYGQQINTYNLILSGPKQEDESEGPSEMYIVLVDDDRSSVLIKSEQRKAALCINCGACYNVCPVYKTIGGHAYGTNFGGPIGSIALPLRKGMQDYRHLSFASTLCGACTVVCPMNIPLHRLLLINRRDIVSSGFTSKKEKLRLIMYKQSMKKRKLLEITGSNFKNIFLKKSFGTSWGKNREIPLVTKKSFSRQYKEKNSIK